MLLAALALAVVGCEGQAPSELPPPPQYWGPANTYTSCTFPAGEYRRLEWVFHPVVAPPESLHRKGLLHYYAMQFHLGPERNVGYAGLQTEGHFGGETLGRRVINYAIWNAGHSRSHGLINATNEECGCAQIMLPYEWEVGRDYRFVLDLGPSGEDEHGRWWGLWVTDVEADSTTFVGETRAPPELGGLNVAHKPVAWGEDLHWWHTLEGRRHYQCEDFEPSSTAIFDVTVGDSVVPTSLESFTNGETKATGSNGHETMLCSSPNIYESGTAVQHNLGYWVTPAPNVLGGR